MWLRFWWIDWNTNECVLKGLSSLSFGCIVSADWSMHFMEFSFHIKFLMNLHHKLEHMCQMWWLVSKSKHISDMQFNPQPGHDLTHNVVIEHHHDLITETIHPDRPETKCLVKAKLKMVYGFLEGIEPPSFQFPDLSFNHYTSPPHISQHQHSFTFIWLSLF